MAREQRKLAAIVAVDVVGYSRLMGRGETLPSSIAVAVSWLSATAKSASFFFPPFKSGRASAACPLFRWPFAARFLCLRAPGNAKEFNRCKDFVSRRRSCSTRTRAIPWQPQTYLVA